MNIVHTIPSGAWAGSEKVAFGLASVQARSHNVTVVAKSGSGFCERFYRKRLPENAELIMLPDALKTPDAIASYVLSNLRRPPEVVHGHLGLGCKVARSLRGAHRVAVGHMHIRFLTPHFKDLDAVVAVSPWQLRDVPDWYKGRRTLVPNFLTEQSSASVEEIARFRRKWHIQDGDFVIGTACGLHIEKGVDTLIRAFIEADIAGTKLIIIGDGPYRDAIAMQAAHRDDVILAGFMPDASRYMPVFDLFVSPSRADSFGLALLEALTQGVPSVASGTLGSLDMLGESNRIFGIGDYKQLASLLARVKDGEELDSVDLSRYSAERSAGLVCAFYEQLLHEKKNDQS